MENDPVKRRRSPADGGCSIIGFILTGWQASDNLIVLRYNASQRVKQVCVAMVGDQDLKDTRVAILGLGLMGGSLALALRGHVAHILGVEPQALTRQMALREGIVDDVVEALTSGTEPFDLLVLAAPIRAILQCLSTLPQVCPDGCEILDLGSTKRAVTAAMSALPEKFAAIGGHPMCGKETSGLGAAVPDLYRGQTFVLCRTPRTTPGLETRIMGLLAVLEAHPVFLEAAEHDMMAAAVSHMPYLVSATLMRLATGEEQWAISASGFRDTARLAGTNPRMMFDILLTNRDAILPILTAYQSDLAVVRHLLEQENESELMEWLAGAQVRYAAYRRFRSSGQG